MSRGKYFPALLAVLATTLAIFIAATSATSAQQNPLCCTYVVEIQSVIWPCNQVRLVTRWNCASGSLTLFKTYPGPSVTMEPIGPPLLDSCPPACTLQQISIDNINFIGPNQIKQVFVGNCCYTVSFTYDVNGCIRIKIAGC